MSKAQTIGARAAAVASEAVLMNTLLEGKGDGGAKRGRLQKETKIVSQHSALFKQDVQSLMHPRLVSESFAAILKT